MPFFGGADADDLRLRSARIAALAGLQP